MSAAQWMDVLAAAAVVGLLALHVLLGARMERLRWSARELRHRLEALEQRQARAPQARRRDPRRFS